uniref:Immunoglobulin domain-containing protein n=1 Tax=Gasterosteus aculeatus aculeatus TaxID=481459 RepID=A0AAQ4PIZ5_GASAC
VSVKAGGSISIPCLYSSQYTNHVKYLCKGYYWNYCTHEVKTNQKNSAKFSISDDKIQKIFTVTVNKLTNNDSHYWCAVEINDGADDRDYFHLSVTTGTNSLYVDNQEKTAFLGGDVTIKCHHQRNPGEMRWCRMGSSCVTQRSGSIDGTEVTIDRNVPNVFSVTMRGLKTESSGWYLCVSGNLQFPVRLTVTEQPTKSKYYNYKRETYRNASFGRTETLILTRVLIFTLLSAFFFWFMLKIHSKQLNFDQYNCVILLFSSCFYICIDSNQNLYCKMNKCIFTKKTEPQNKGTSLRVEMSLHHFDRVII